MNQKLQKIIDIFQKSENLSTEEKDSVLKALKDTDKELEITAFKLERTEKVKKTTAILLEETIEELEQKRKAVENQNRELEIEASLERVRAVAMSMTKSDDLLSICEISFKEFQKLGFHNLRNAIIHILNDEKESFMDYDFSDSMGGSITNIDYNSHPVVEDYLKQIKSAEDAFAEVVIEGSQLIDWKKFRRESGQHDDNRLDDIPALYYYFHSIGVGDIGISTFNPIDESQIKILKRFRNVFDLAYRTYTDITKAESQARESQIQLALERVRARTMAMHKSEELSETSFVLFEQLKELGEVAEQISIIIYNEEEGIIELYATIYGNQWEEIGKIPFQKHFVHRKIYNAWKENEKSFVIDLSGKELNDFNKFKMEHSSQYKSEDDLPQVRWVIHNAFFSKGTLVFSTHEPRPLETIQLLERFAGVFEQTYTRFLDLKKAEAQARESQIELGLERVRARAMAMQKSDELSELVDTVFKELTKLDFALNWCIINIIDVSTLSNMVWAANPDIDKAPDSYHMKFEDYPFHDAMMKGYKKRATKYIYVLEGLEKKVYDEYLFNETEFRKVPEEAQAASRAMDKYVCSFTFSNFGGIQTVGDEPLSDSNLDILERFGKVFDLTYTRFNDLKKAEAQAREAQIEAALERVRSRTMGMQKSEELKEVIQLVYEQFVHLNIHIEHTGFIMDYKVRDDMHIWLADKHEVPSEVTLPYFDCAHWNSFNEAKEKGIDFFANHLTFEEKNKFYQDLFKFIPGVPEETLEYYFGCPGLAISTVLLDDVGLYIENFSGIPYSDGENNTLIRFGKVFQQTYTRFNDLKQAEAQAREAQNEAALEKVRSKTMAMQKSDELAETAYVLYEQFGLLGESPEQLTIGIIDETQMIFEFWLTLGGNQIDHVFKAPIDEPVVLYKIYSAWKEQKKSIVIDIAGDELKTYYNFFKNLPDYKEFSDFKNNQKPEYRRVIHTAFFSMGSLSLASPEPKPVETIQLLERFAGVFDGTYTRFLDLKKAEAQAREAQIEAALERVRSRSMAMHHTSELQDVINAVHRQFKILDIAITGGAFIAINEENKNEITCWGAGGTADYIERVHIPFLDRPIYTGLIECIQKGTGFFTEEFSYEEKIEFFNHLFKHPPYIDTSPEHKKEVLSRQGGYTRSCAVSKYTNIFIINHHGRKFSEEENNILMRFGKVFEQTYTRFLDLQNAEAQAREAQIEAALERVRSRSMAMHHSEELKEVVAQLFEGVDELGFDATVCNVSLINKENDTTDVWTAHRTKQGISSYHVFVPSLKHSFYKELLNTFYKNKDFAVHELFGKEKKSYIRELFSKVDYSQTPEAVREANKELVHSDEPIVLSAATLKYGMLVASRSRPLTTEEAGILQRFAKVFEQTYTRFLDLQNAEAQAREAQIEAALERVRSKAMAMHSSEDLATTVDTFFSELNTLEVTSHRCGVGIVDADTRTTDIHANTTTHDNEIKKVAGKLKLSGHPVLDSIFENWKLQKEYHPVLHGKEIVDYYKVMDPQVKFPDFADDETQYGYYFYFKEGGVFAWTDNELTERDLQIFRRYTSVLSLTYRRYMDLKEAEAQAREAQIEAALERVRSKTMAMQRSEELTETAAVVFKQLIYLGIAPNRLYIGIINDESGNVDFWITDEDGSKVSEKFTGKSNRNDSVKKMYDGWKKMKKSVTIDMQGKELENYFQYLGNELQVPFKLGLSQKRRVQTIAYFSNGFIGIASPDEQPEETTILLERIAAVFNLTYTRFNDLQQAEAQNKIIQADNERKTKELEEARQLQLSMLPKELPKIPNLDIAVYMQTATEVGGDYYDFNVGIDGMLTTILGDATGHGMKAGTVVTITKSLFNSMAANENILGTFEKISQVIKGMKFRQLAMCLIMMKIKGNRLSMSSAAMPPALIYRAKNKTVEEILLKGMPLGTMRKFPYKKIESHLNTGDRILLYSDGLPELANNNDEMFGYDRIKTEFHSAGEKAPEEIVDHLKNSASQWANGKVPDDDVTFVVIKVK